MTAIFGLVAMFFLYSALALEPIKKLIASETWGQTIRYFEKICWFCAATFTLPHMILGFSKLNGKESWSLFASLAVVTGVLAVLIGAWYIFQTIKVKSYAQSLRGVAYLTSWLVLVHGLTITLNTLRLTQVLSLVFIAVWILGILEIKRFQQSISAYFNSPKWLYHLTTVPALTLLLWQVFF